MEEGLEAKGLMPRPATHSPWLCTLRERKAKQCSRTHAVSRSPRRQDDGARCGTLDETCMDTGHWWNHTWNCDGVEIVESSSVPGDSPTLVTSFNH